MPTVFLAEPASEPELGSEDLSAKKAVLYVYWSVQAGAIVIALEKVFQIKLCDGLLSNLVLHR